MKLRIPIRLLALLFCVSAFLGCQSAGVSPSPEAAQAKVSISGSVRLNAIFSGPTYGGGPGPNESLVEDAFRLYGEGQFAEALKKLQAVLGERGEGAIYDKHREGQIRILLARIYLDLGLFSEAQAEHTKALKLAIELRDPKLKMVTLLESASLADRLNDFETRLFILSMVENARRGLDDPGLQVLALNQTAAALTDLGDPAAALQRLLEALSISRRINRRYEILQLGVLGDFYGKIGEFSKALDYFTKAQAEAKESGDAALEGYSLVYVGLTYFVLGKNEDAIRAARQGLQIARAMKASKWEAPESLGRLGLLAAEYNALHVLRFALTAQGRYDEALRIAEELLQLAMELGSPYQIKQAHAALGDVLLEMGEYAKAADAYTGAIELTEGLRARIPVQQQQMGFLARELSPYDGIIRALYNSYVATALGKTLVAHKALLFAEWGKSKTWVEQLSRHRMVAVQDTLPPEVRARERDMFREGLAAYNDYARVSSRHGIPMEKREKAEAAWRLAAEKLATFQEELHRKYPRYAAVRYGQVFPLDALPIRDGETLIVYKLGPDWAYAWVIKKTLGRNGILKFIQLPVKTREIEKLVERFLAPMRTGKDTQFATDVAGELFRKIFRPVIEGIFVSSRLVIVPDGVLTLVPFETLVMEVGKNGDGQTARFVGDQFVLSYYPSATILTINRQTVLPAGPPPGSLLAVGDPVYGPDDERVAPSQVSSLREDEKDQESRIITRRAKVRKGAQQQGYTFGRLKYSGEEVLKISEVLGGRSGPRDVLTGFNASESRVKSKDLTRYRYLHFAVHGVLSYDVPYLKEPALVLGVEPDSKEDGFLTLSEISGLKLNADLVTLSSCKTGLGVRVAGEGVIGLSRAFMLAGARSVLVSLWEVADHSTALLMEEFYRLLGQGVDKAEALAKAKRHLREKGYENPFFWAPFVLMGD